MNQITQDAQEFGVHLRSGGWRLGLLVARSVQPGAGNPAVKRTRNDRSASKVSGHEFARLAGTSAPRTLRYYDAWERAALAGHVPPAADLQPGIEVELPDDEQVPWSDYYSAGRSSNTESVKRSKPAVARAIAEDPEFAAAAADALAEHRPAAIAAVAAQPDVARAIARRDESREAVEEAGIKHRAISRPDTTGQSTPKEAGRKASGNMARSMGEDPSTMTIRQAAALVAEAVAERELFGVNDLDAQAAAIRDVRHWLAVFEAEGDLTDEDRAFLDRLGIDG